MADLTMTPVATQIQPQRPMTLGEMLNLASGVQQYQQAQQMMPLQLEAQRLAVEQATKVNPLLAQQQEIATRVAAATEQPRIAQQAAQTGLAQTQEQQAMFALSGDKRAAALNIAGAYAVDPRIVSPKTPDEPVKALTEAFTALRSRGLSETEALTQISPFMTMAVTQPGQLSTMLQAAVRQGVGTAGQLPLQTPAITTQFGGQPAVVAPGALGTTQVQPLPMPGAAPAPAGAAAAPAGPTSGVVLRYPVRQAGVPFAEGPSEAADRDAGTKYRVGLQQTQTTLPLMRRNLEEVNEKAKSLAATAIVQTGKLADFERGLRQTFGDTRYKELSKDLANLEIAELQAMGQAPNMQTDAGKQLLARSVGDATYPPDVLIKIANRISANVTKMDLEAQAAERFSQRFGDNNLTSFRTTWQSNADTRIFQAMNIMRDIKDPAERAKEIDKLFGTNPADRKRYFEQYQRIKRMVETGAPE